MQRKILVIRGGAIGDFILTLPVLAALRARFPQPPLEVLGYPHIAGLAQWGGLADAVRPIESRALAGFFVRGGQLQLELCEYFASCSLIVSYLYDPDGVFQDNVLSCTSAQFIAGPHRPNEAAGVHATEVFLKPLEALDITGADGVPRLSQAVPAPVSTPSGQPLRVALHPGSGSERKNWPARHWQTLLQQILAQSSWQVTLVGGEAEGDRLEQLAALAGGGRLTLLRNRPLTEVAEQLTGCQLFVGHDSGITHLAAALGVPSLVLWGPSVEAVWRPRGAHVHLVRHPQGLAALPPTTVWEALRRMMPDF
ncbi:glycosyltransferase family 9 protein [Fontisphaera persica]|uniref:glycosyltransferase family 9 protein n=1 Tax=Fontisphaera persica TaxID=2974023 RepID=UPI0024C04C9A|nr:glycosyltransferase family 9 protein [Fontisphaera persica]WCJ58675.1 glycosyltransferase family 9 protein [Fontisphaera persica]